MTILQGGRIIVEFIRRDRLIHRLAADGYSVLYEGDPKKAGNFRPDCLQTHPVDKRLVGKQTPGQPLRLQ